uniref:Zinc finger protein n=1 Tax=Peronospora matthiolae TaxID=2874970 RepID=A0AAV1U129_9STRA
MEPIAKRLKQSAENVLHNCSPPRQEEDIADRIKRLEAELQGERDDDSIDSDFSSDSDDNGKVKNKAVVNLSVYASERIEALPEKLLPAARWSSKLPPGKKKTSGKTQHEDDEQAAHEALKQLSDALTFPKKVPFACKPCKFIGKDMDEFQAHRASKKHLERVKSEDSTLQCVLCAKSFTSQSQVDEHRAGKWHKQRAQQKKERHTVQVCYDFIRGTCTYGDRCSFEHTETKAMRAGRALDKTRRRVCGNFARTKNCRFGDKCLFSHDVKRDDREVLATTAAHLV